MGVMVSVHMSIPKLLFLGCLYDVEPSVDLTSRRMDVVIYLR